MDTTGKKLTDRELIDLVLAWYRLDQSAEELRSAVALYLQNPPGAVPTVVDVISFEAPDPAISLTPSRNGSSLITPVHKSEKNAMPGTGEVEPNEVTYEPQFEPTDELIGSRGWLIDIWALYYGVEECVQRISFGLINMHMLAFLFCILITVAVAIGAWQSNLSTERQKKATFKSMVIEPVDKTPRNASSQPSDAPLEQNELLTDSESTTTTEPTVTTEVAPDTIAQSASADPANADSVDAVPSATVKSPSVKSRPVEPVASEPVAIEPVAIEPVAIETARAEFGPALGLMEKSLWNEALENLNALEKTGGRELQPLLTLVKIEALIRKHDEESMELARQLLVDCKWGEFDIVYDLLAARWMLLASSDDRARFLSESASLPDAARRRMSLWARIRNYSKDAMSEVILKTLASKGQSEVCDLLFIASFHFNVGRYDETIRELLEVQQKLRALHVARNNSVENWLLETARSQLASKTDDILNLVRDRLKKEIN